MSVASNPSTRHFGPGRCAVSLAPTYDDPHEDPLWQGYDAGHGWATMRRRLSGRDAVRPTNPYLFLGAPEGRWEEGWDMGAQEAALPAEAM